MQKQNFSIMSYIENLEQIQNAKERSTHDEVLIHVQKEFFQEAPMRKQDRSEVSNEELKLSVTEFLVSKGIELDENQWKESNAIVLNNLSALTLHSLALKAEELGKKISYSRSLTIKISD